MIAYWLLFFAPVLGAALERSRQINFSRMSLSRLPVSWLFLWLLLTTMIGYRHEVGGDWLAYLYYLERIKPLSFTDALLLSDPGYQLLNYIAYNVGGDIYTVNLLAGSIFSFGLIVFCRSQPRPYLSLVTAIPYLVIVIAMGYTRQSIALSLSMLAIVSLIHKGVLKFTFWIVLAALFHKSAVLLIPLAALLSNRNRYLTFIWIVMAAFLAYVTLLQSAVDNLYVNYVEAQYQSQGALIRVAMCFIPSLIFLRYKKKLYISKKESQIWTWFSILSIVAFLILFITSASTAVDRVALYLLPIQLVVFSHLPEVLGARHKPNAHWVCAVTIYYAVVLFVWLFFAAHAFAWLPYQFYPFTLL